MRRQRHREGSNLVQELLASHSKLGLSSRACNGHFHPHGAKLRLIKVAIQTLASHCPSLTTPSACPLQKEKKIAFYQYHWLAPPTCINFLYLTLNNLVVRYLIFTSLQERVKGLFFFRLSFLSNISSSSPIYNPITSKSHYFHWIVMYFFKKETPKKKKPSVLEKIHPEQCIAIFYSLELL